jgi:hypothetical protein
MRISDILCMGLTMVNDWSLLQMIRAGFHVGVTTIEMSGTNLGSCPLTSAQVLKVLKRIRGGRWAFRPTVLIGLKGTELEDHHFHRIIDAVSQLGQRIPVEGRAPERLELLDVSCASF